MTALVVSVEFPPLDKIVGILGSRTKDCPFSNSHFSALLGGVPSLSFLPDNRLFLARLTYPCI
jgi:hypothetical protein